MSDIAREEYFITSDYDAHRLYASLWLPEGEPLAVVQLCHGMAEYISRYDGLARALAEAGFAVCGIDLRGHGKTCGENGVKGYFAPRNGWDVCVGDLISLKKHTSPRFEGKPYFLFGHSMGSFLARTIAGRCGYQFDGFIFSGTAGTNQLLWAGRGIAAFCGLFGGARKNRLLELMSFGAYAKAFAPYRTVFDWLTRDEAVVDAYVDDDFCGFTFTTAAFHDLFNGLNEIQSKAWAKSVPDKPMLIYSGDKDPVGGFGKGVKEVAHRLRAEGHTDVTLRLFPDGRHEMHNETNREEVYDLLREWLAGAIINEKLGVRNEE